MSRTTYAIYIPQLGLEDLRIGMASGVWGWRQSAFDTSESASVIRSMKVDDLVLMAQGGPETLEALRMSANKRGVPVVVSTTTSMGGAINRAPAF